MKREWSLVAICLLMFGCRANDDSIQAFISQAHNQALAQVAPLDEQVEFVAEEFVMTSPRVPFIRPRPGLAASGQDVETTCWQPDLRRERQALESYPLAQLSMKGVLLNDFDLKPVKQHQQQEVLSLTVSASTYRFKAS